MLQKMNFRQQLTVLLSIVVLAMLVLPGWGVIGLAIYFGYARSRSHVGLGHVEVHEDDPDAPPQPVPPVS